MTISDDLISKFVKITNDGNKQEPKESVVYGTATKYNGEMYVKIDGSDLLTPANTTTDIDEGERVTIMIKNHEATITGNITSPSAKLSEVRAINVDIENLVARDSEIYNSTIENFDVIDGVIEDLKADYAEIEELVATKAEIGDLRVGNISEASSSDKAYITLFGTCSLDASADAIRLQCDAYNYIYIDGGQLEYYSKSGGSAGPTWAWYGGTATQTMYTNSNTFTVNSSGMTIEKGGYHSSGTSHLDYIQCKGSMTIATIYSTTISNEGNIKNEGSIWTDELEDYSGVGITLNSAFNGNNQNLGYSGSKFYQLSAKYVWGDNGSVSDEKFKENIRYINQNRHEKSVLKDFKDEVIRENTKTRTYDPDNLIMQKDFHDFVKDELDICEFNYIREEDEKIETDFSDKIGLIANDYSDSKIGSKIVGYTSEGFYAVNTNNLIFVTLGALQYEIEKRDEQISKLEDRLNNLESKNN